MKQLLLNFAEINSPSLGNFIVDNNIELLHTLRNVASGKVDAGFYYLWGNTGSGKSHLLRAVVSAFLQQQEAACYVDCARTNSFVFDPDLVCVAVDNVDSLDAVGQIGLFNLYNRIRENNHGVFIASGEKPPAQLNLRRDLTTRLGWGLVYHICELSDEKKAKVMRDYATQCGFELPDEVSNYLLNHQNRNLSFLISTIDTLGEISLVKQRPVTLPLLRAILGCHDSEPIKSEYF